MRNACVVACGFVAVGLALGVASAHAAVRQRVTVLGKTEGAKSIRLSRDGRRVAYVTQKGLGQAVVVDGKEGRAYPEVLSVTLSPCGKHVAYVAKKGKAGPWVVVLDGKEGRPYARILERATVGCFLESIVWDRTCIDGKPFAREVVYRHICFSPDGKRVIYSARRERDPSDCGVLVVDGQEQFECWGGRNRVIFSPDCRRLAFVVRTLGSEHWHVVVDGKQIRPPKLHPGYEVGPVRFSPDGRRVAYVLTSGSRRAVVADGKPGRFYWRIPSGPLFSPDGKHLAYVADGDGMRVVVDGQEQRKYNRVDGFRFSPDGKRLAYIVTAVRGGRFLCGVVVNGEEGKLYAGGIAAPLYFSPDGRHLAYIVGSERGQRIVVDGKEGKERARLIPPVLPGVRAPWADGPPIRFSPNGRRWVHFAVTRDGRTVAVFDGREIPLGKRVPTPLPEWEFSPDSARYAFIYYPEWPRGRQANVDGKDGERYWAVYGLTFSPDSKHVAYVAVTDRLLHSCVVVNGKPGRTHGPLRVPDCLRRESSPDWVSPTPFQGGWGPGWGFWVRPVRFSPSGGRLLYAFRQTPASKTWRVAVDDWVCPHEFDLLPWRGVERFFDGPDRLHFVAVKDGQILLVELEIVE